MNSAAPKLLLAHRKLSDKYKQLQAELNSKGTLFSTDIATVLNSLDLISNLFSFADINSRDRG